MKKSRKIFYVAVGIGLALLVFSLFRAWKRRDTRPTLEDARDLFKELYPGVEIKNLKITEDEIYARNFLFQYWKPGAASGKSIEIQFMKEKGASRWIPTPSAPAELK